MLLESCLRNPYSHLQLQVFYRSKLYNWPVYMIVRSMRRADNLNTILCGLSWNLGASTFWKPQGMYKPAQGWLYPYYFLCVSRCSLRYPASNAHAACCHLWPAPLYSTFPHYLIKGRILEKEKNYWTWIVCYDFLTTFVWSISHSQKTRPRYDHKCILICT